MITPPILKNCIKKDLVKIVNKYSKTSQEQEQVFNLIKLILQEGF